MECRAMSDTYIFGYGSLVNVRGLERFLGRELDARDYRYCRLKGYRRAWNVAMDNRVDLPDYRYFLLEENDIRPEVFVTFLNIVPAPESAVNGILFRVNERELHEIDRRERNYRFMDVSGSLDHEVKVRVLVNVGTDEGMERYEMGLQTGNAVVSRSYAGEVDNAFRSLGEKSHNEYIESTDPPVASMERLRQVATG
jgi:cation transport regulator ChaC